MRGETIRSAADIGWINSLTVGRMMRPVQAVVQQEMALEAFRREYPLGSTQRVVVTNEHNAYVGIAYPAEAFGLVTDAGQVADILHHGEHFLLPSMTVKEAIAAFETAEADSLAVLDATATRNVIGLLTEQYALRRYNEQLDRRRRELSGEI